MANKKPKIIFPEYADRFGQGGDPRIVAAVEVINQAGFCQALTLKDFPVEVFENNLPDYYIKKRHGKETEVAARMAMENPIYQAAGLLALGYADMAISGSLASTKEVLQAGLRVLGLAPGNDLLSSYFLIKHQGRDLAFADCAVIENPTAKQLASIAITTADNFKKHVGQEPKIAMLSYSTHGSAKSPMIDKVTEALSVVKKTRPDLIVDGELQFDAAFDSGVAKIKAPNSVVAGQANIFIFPDLASGNIAYKVAERMAGAKAIGPIVQGLAKPFMDLSRGCNVSDVVELAKFITGGNN